MPKYLEQINDKDGEKCVEMSHRFKDFMFDIGYAFALIKGKKSVDGLRFSEFCKTICKLDSTFIDTCVLMTEKLTKEEAYLLTIKEIRAYCKRNEDPNAIEEKPKFLTIKLHKEAEKVVKEAHQRFIEQENIGADSAYGFMFESLCADYLASVPEISNEAHADYYGSSTVA